MAAEEIIEVSTGMNNPYLERISVVNVRQMNQGNLKAFDAIKLGNTMTINGCRIIQQPGQRAYVALPQYKNENGQYYPIITADDPRFKDAVEQVVLEAWQSE